VEEGPDRSF